jgi:hypothetical protein
MADFRIGDRVKSRTKGTTGTVTAIETGGTNVVVRWDDHPVERAVAASDLKVIDAGD